MYSVHATAASTKLFELRKSINILSVTLLFILVDSVMSRTQPRAHFTDFLRILFSTRMYALHCARRFRSSIDPKETLKFSKLSHDWWNPVGTSRFLHAMNPCRLEFITAKVPLDYHPVTIMDIGCGAGILTEPLARRFNGSHVIGIDSVIESIDVAIKHAKLDPK